MFHLHPLQYTHSLFPRSGVVRGNGDGRQCTRVQKWNGHLCTSDLEYHVLHVESGDWDTETRRISPVGLMSYPLEQSYPDNYE